MENNSVSICYMYRVAVLAFCTFSDCPLLLYKVIFNTLLQFQRYAPNKFFYCKNYKGSNSINTGDKVTVLALCTFSDSTLSMNQVSYYSLLNFHAYAPVNLFIAKQMKFLRK